MYLHFLEQVQISKDDIIKKLLEAEQVFINLNTFSFNLLKIISKGNCLMEKMGG